MDKGKEIFSRLGKEMNTLEIEIAHGKINLQCGTKVRWMQTFPEMIPLQLQPYVGVSLEESWNHFQSHFLERTLADFNEDIQPALRFHLCTCIFSILAFIGNVALAISFRHNKWREIYPVTSMVIVFLVVLITQYRTLVIFRESIDILTRRLQKELEKTLLHRKTRSRGNLVSVDSNVDEKNIIGIKSLELEMKNVALGKGSTRTLLYTAKIGLGATINDTDDDVSDTESDDERTVQAFQII